jgi:DNA primase
MKNQIDELKQIDLVEFLSRNYGLEFRFTGKEYVCRSPFTEDKNPSFYVRKADDGHWIFKCFSSGHAGSIIDFIQMKENLGNVRDVIKFIDERVNVPAAGNEYGGATESGAGHSAGASKSYDVGYLYELIRKRDITVSREYLIARGISGRVIDELIAADILLHNRHSGHSYCCFVVRGAGGELMCLDNHQVGGDRKFVLGEKSPFSQDWDRLPESEEVFICESIIDYLSIKTLESSPLPGLALLGNQVEINPELLGKTRTIHAALDDDEGGYSAIWDIQDQFPDREIRMYDLEGHKDPNELLMSVRSGKGRKLSSERKLQLYREFQRSSNKAELARRWGIDRSYMYEIVRECDKAVLDMFSNRSPGRKPMGKPISLDDAWRRIKQLEEEYERVSTEREQFYCRSELLKLRLKWAEIEVAQSRGEPVDERTGPKKKSHVKKKRKKRRSKRSPVSRMNAHG